jgi:hypothetical protein
MRAASRAFAARRARSRDRSSVARAEAFRVVVSRAARRDARVRS